MDIDILQFYKTHIEQLPLTQRLKLLELLMQSTIETIRREKELEPAGSQAEEDKVEGSSPRAPETELTELQKQLREGPVMSDEDYDLYREKKQHFTR